MGHCLHMSLCRVGMSYCVACLCGLWLKEEKEQEEEKEELVVMIVVVTKDGRKGELKKH